MTAKQAMIYLCQIYRTDIKDVQVKPVEKWLEKNIQETEMQKFVGKILQNVKTEYEKLPSVATLEEIKKPDKNLLEQLAHQKFNELINKVDSYRDFITDDNRIQAGLDAIGGWLALCNSLKNELKWLRKDFIKAFIQEGINPITICKRSYGIGTSKKYNFIGNEKKCLEIIKN
jgi:hypothetical protein